MAVPPELPAAAKAENTTKVEKPTFIDLWNVPALVNPSPPSNTLLITNLQKPHIFTAASLQNLYNLLNGPVPLNSFAPLPSLRRIIISYPTIEATIATRQLLEQSASLPTPPDSTTDPHTKDNPQSQSQSSQTTDIRPMKIYFGEPTPLVGQYASETASADHHLQAPSLGKLMFISPPPSPPCGWEIRHEDPPNKATHAEDLLAALAGLGAGGQGGNGVDHSDNENNNDNNNTSETIYEVHVNGNREFAGGAQGNGNGNGNGNGRKRRSTLTVYHPRDHGHRDDLPAVMVEDTTGDDDLDLEAESSGGGALPTRTARPPVELMDVA